MDYGQIIYNTAKGAGINDTLANIIVADARHETADFTSSIFKEGNNAFGYMYVSGSKYQLPQAGRVADNGFPAAKYASVEDSTKELIAWLQRREKEGKLKIAALNTPEAYASALKNAGYYGDKESTYLAGIKKWLSKYPKYEQVLITGGIGVLGVVVISGIIYSVYRYFKK